MKRAGICFVIAVACAVIVASEFLSGAHVWGSMFGMAITGATLDWLVRTRANPTAGIDPVMLMVLTLLVMAPRVDLVAAWLTGH